MGKAKSLRSRVRSYFQKTGNTRLGSAQLVGRIRDVETIVTGTEAEALHLEQSLVKRHRPPFNIRLRDDKSFPYIAVTVEDEYPRVMFTRERHRRGVVYFGPYANAKKVRETLDVLNRAFRFRPCEGPRPGRHSGIPCLDYHIDRCLAPCVDKISPEEYRKIIDGVIGFLSGDTQTIAGQLEAEMAAAAADERFEDAARYRNRLFSVRHLAERQAASHGRTDTVDVIGLAAEEDRAAVQVFPLRDGQLVDRYGFQLENVAGQDIQTIAEEFCLGYYDTAPSIPPEIVLPYEVGHLEALQELLSERRGSASRCGRPIEGTSAASSSSRRRTRSWRSSTLPRTRSREAAARRCCARRAARGAQPREPARAHRMLRHLDDAGPANGRLDGGVPGRHAAEGPVPEVRHPASARAARTTTRRSRGALPPLCAGRRPGQRGRWDESFAAVPNLVVVDGGKPAVRGARRDARVRAAAGRRRLAREAGRASTSPASAARSSSTAPPRASSSYSASGTRRTVSPLAITVKRDAEARDSLLDHLRGVGPARRRALLNHFGSVELRRFQEELEEVPGLPEKTARAVYAQLHKAGPTVTGAG